LLHGRGRQMHNRPDRGGTGHRRYRPVEAARLRIDDGGPDGKRTWVTHLRRTTTPHRHHPLNPAIASTSTAWRDQQSAPRHVGPPGDQLPMTFRSELLAAEADVRSGVWDMSLMTDV